MLLVLMIAALAIVGGRAGEWVMAQLDFRVIASVDQLGFIRAQGQVRGPPAG